MSRLKYVLSHVMQHMFGAVDLLSTFVVLILISSELADVTLNLIDIKHLQLYILIYTVGNSTSFMKQIQFLEWSWNHEYLGSLEK